MTQRKTLLVLLSVLMVFSVFLAACGSDSEETNTETSNNEQTETGETETSESEGVSGEPKQGGNLVVGLSGNPTVFNAFYSNDSVSGDVEDLIYAGLVRADENFAPQPEVAESWEISDDGLEYTFYMKEGVTFHDGEEVTADDVVFSFNIPLHPDYTGPRASSYEKIDKVEALDDYTVKFTLKEVDAPFILTAGAYILPEHILGDVPVAELEDHDFNTKNPIGAGPFKFKEWVDGQHITVEAFDDFLFGRPHLDSITFKFAPDANAEILQLQAGDIDFMVAPASELETIETFDHVKISSTLALRYDYIGWNLQNPLFESKKVRQALTHAIDRQAIIDAVLNGIGEVAHAPGSPLSWAYSDNVPKFDYDPEKAKQLLAEEGWEPGEDGILEKDGMRFSFEILSNDGNTTRRDIGIIVQQMLGDIGIEVNPNQMEWSAFLTQINPPNYDFDAVVLAWSLGSDPDPTAIWHSKEIEQGLNNIHYSRPDLDELMDQNTQVLDQDQRKEIIGEIYEGIAEDQPYTFLFYPLQHIAMPQDMEGHTHHPRVTFYKPHEWWLDR